MELQIRLIEPSQAGLLGSLPNASSRAAFCYTRLSVGETQCDGSVGSMEAANCVKASSNIDKERQSATATASTSSVESDAAWAHAASWSARSIQAGEEKGPSDRFKGDQSAFCVVVCLFATAARQSSTEKLEKVVPYQTSL